MKYSRWLSTGAVIILCLLMTAPLNSQAASSQKNSEGKKIEKVKRSHKKDRISKAGAITESGKKGKKVTEKQPVQNPENPAEKEEEIKKHIASFEKEDREKEIWQKRARGSKMITGKASWFGKDFHNRKTASGLLYDMFTFTAAHRTLPLGTVVKVTDADNGKSVMVCIADRGPYVHGRIIDLSYAAAKKLDLAERGVGKVKLEVVSDEKGAPLNPGQAYFIKYSAGNGKKIVGPFKGFADAVAMHEALRKAHPEAEVFLGKTDR